ncbi:MAG: hypothetical protein IPH86_13265 [bacterium]|nr:hypothetical protein [bacterium]
MAARTHLRTGRPGSDFAQLGTLPGLAARQGLLSESGAALLAAIEATQEARRRLERLLIFANLRSDEDTRVGEDTTARKGRAASLSVRYAEAVSWFESEVLEIEPERLAALVASEAGLGLYAHFFENIHRGRAHTLPADQEALLAGAGSCRAAPARSSTPSTMPTCGWAR